MPLIVPSWLFAQSHLGDPLMSVCLPNSSTFQSIGEVTLGILVFSFYLGIETICHEGHNTNIHLSRPSLPYDKSHQSLPMPTDSQSTLALFLQEHCLAFPRPALSSVTDMNQVKTSFTSQQFSP
jgi:hypothetical protein